MSAWDDLLKLAQAGDVQGTIRRVGELTPAERRSVAAEPARRLARRRAAGISPWEHRQELSPLLLTGAGVVGGASAVASWLLRRDFRDLSDRNVPRVLEVLRARPDDWRADLAVRLARRLRLVDGWTWRVAAELVRETGVEPPPDADAFKTGWLRTLEPDRAAGDPLLAAYGPRLFEIDGLATLPLWEVADNVVRLVEAGLLERTVVLDGLVRRLLRDGPAALPPLAGLHDRLDPDLDEIARHAEDYVALLPAGPIAVADLALAQLRRLEEAGRLSEESFTEALEALAFRPEKKLLRGVIAWAGDAVLRDGGRTGTVLRAMALLFAQDTLALQERAVRLAVRLAPQAGPEERAAVRAAAAGLPGELREKVAAGYGGAIDADEPEAVPLPAAGDGRRLPAPYGSPEELARGIDVFLSDEDPHTFEVLLAGLATWSERDPEGLRAALRPWTEPLDASFFGHWPDGLDQHAGYALRRAFLAFAASAASRSLPSRSRRWTISLAVLDEPPARRCAELAGRYADGGRYPVVLATPTAVTGHVAPGVLLDRLERLEAEGVEALPADLTQALLRLPREIAAADVARAGRLASEAGRACAAWMRGERLGDPEVTVGRDSWSWLRVTIDAAGAPERGRELLEIRAAHSWSMDWWPLVMPSHRDVVAAHLVSPLAEGTEATDSDARVLVDLVHGDGPLGAGMAYALACGMGQAQAAGRAAAGDALLTLAARGEVPAAELAEVVTKLVKSEYVKLNRVVAVLDDATQAGAHEAVWEVVARLLPGLLPEEGERPRAGLADLLAAGARAARIGRVRADLPEVAAIAARKGSSRLIQEARRLQRLLQSSESTL
ncbi:DUF6493 family protein [Nonomuraea sp. LP-02]|uniref:DUF7825 domain-containing protein n=1 Tax=Nonomuraea sp. LP-02 TaxID=3097960 RepID=UPI002E323FFA|nr:DUF6493 family protein [Nonomuraea sp. LP-02]MED7924152.1 DUF6493 family protein [Nonomuraea sp. LP-02]